MQEEIIRYENIGIFFGSKKVISGFSLRILRDQKILLRGKSETGKSTLFKMLLGFESPSEGSLFYKKKPVNSHVAWEIRKEVGYISQDTDLGEGTVKNLLDEIFSYRPNREKKDSKKLNVMMKEFELDKEILEKTLRIFLEGKSRG